MLHPGVIVVAPDARDHPTIGVVLATEAETVPVFWLSTDRGAFVADEMPCDVRPVTLTERATMSDPPVDHVLLAKALLGLWPEAELTPLAAVIARYVDRLQDGGSDEVDGAKCYVLVEANVRTDQVWLSSHGSHAAAADYHDRQDRVEDWEIIELVSLDTGERWHSFQRTQWWMVSLGAPS